MTKKDEEIKKTFFGELRHNKLYLLSFLITVAFFGACIVNDVIKSEGMITKQRNANKILKQVKKKSSNSKTTNNDGVYKTNMTLSRTISIGACDINEYSFLIEVKNNKYTKYFSNSCIGTVLMNNITDNISIKNKSFKLDNYTYNKDDSIDLKETKSNIEVNIYKDNILLLGDDNLIVLNNDSIIYTSSDIYQNNGGKLTKRYYSNNNTYKFIVFENNIEEDCSTVSSKDNNKVYTIYSITYDVYNNKLGDPVELVSRYNNDLCNYYEEDMKLLQG